MNAATPAAPLIVTARLPADLQALADRLRTAHFPPERNFLQAHVTLFHALPGSLLDEVRALLARLSSGTAPVPARLDGIMDLGGGTALRIHSPAMQDMRAEVAEHFHGMLTAQDRGNPRLHITVQNKVLRAEARALQAQLAAQVPARDFVFAGFALHHYRGGPWEAAGHWAFRRGARA